MWYHARAMGKGHRKGWKKKEIKREGRKLSKISIKRRRDGAIMVIAIVLGLIGNFVFQKVEIAAILWLFAVLFSIDLFFTISSLARLKTILRIILGAICVADSGAR